MNNDLLRYLAKLQTDDEPGIRTNTTICLGKISKYFSESVRQIASVLKTAAMLLEMYAEPISSTDKEKSTCPCIHSRPKGSISACQGCQLNGISRYTHTHISNTKFSLYIDSTNHGLVTSHFTILWCIRVRNENSALCLYSFNRQGKVSK